MKIERTEIRPCLQPMRDAKWKFARAALAQMHGNVVVLTDELGNQGLGYLHSIPAITGPGTANRAAAEWLCEQIAGATIEDLGATADDLDARLAMNPSAKAAIDMALHDLRACRDGVPVHTLLGTQRRTEIAQSRIVPIKTPDEMAAAAGTLAAEGYRQVKLKLSGDTPLDVKRIAAVREAVGQDVAITLDPNQSYAADQMIDAFRQMERYRIALIEQPVPAHDIEGLARCTRELPADIEADETAQTVHDVRRLVAGKMIDVINLKITKLGGVRRFVEAVRICEAGGVIARVGAAFGPALLQGFAAHAASIVGALPHACELSEHNQLLDDPFTPVPVTRGIVTVPEGPGCGVRYAA